MDWILFGLSGQADLHKTFETGLEAEAKNDNLFELKFYSTNELIILSDHIRQYRTKKSSPSIGRKAKKKRGDSALFDTIKQSLNWQYGYTETTAMPSKQSVTSLTHREDEFAVVDYSKSLERLPVALMNSQSRLAAASEGRIVGTAIHTVIEKLDLRRPVNREIIETVIENLIGQGTISSEAAGRIDAESIAAFFESEPGQLALEETNVIEREWPFTYAMEAAEGEEIIVQGIIDMLIKTEDGLWIIDFKTDRVSSEQIQNRAESYRGQLELYGEAAETILKSKLLGRWLYFLSPRCAVNI
jgi:ATP-dependent helicase/nuclease subunit A